MSPPPPSIPLSVTNCPVLLMIALYERRKVWARSWAVGDGERNGGRGWRHFGLNPYGDIQAVFRMEPSADVVEMLDKLDSDLNMVGFGRQGGSSSDGLGGDGLPLRDREEK